MKLAYSLRRIGDTLLKLSAKAMTIVTFLAIAGVVYDIGFDKTPGLEKAISVFYSITFLALLILLPARFLLRLTQEMSSTGRIFDVVVILFVFLVAELLVLNTGLLTAHEQINPIIASKLLMRGLLLVISLVELSRSSLQLHKIRINPSLLFAGSFMLLILIGTGLLMMPRSTVNGISLVDALFTATSAVCVTGLIVVDTATAFTPLGQWLILLLLQLGGIGIMTFTSFFGFIFQGHASLKTEIYIRDFISEDRLGNIFKTLLKIVLFTFFVEVVGAIFIYCLVDAGLFLSASDRIMYSVFHSISAFCNAGFSTMTDGLYHTGFRSNYGLHFCVAWLIIIGGLGFPIFFNYYKFIKSFVLNKMRRLLKKGRIEYMPRVISINTRLVIRTTAILLLAGTVFYYIFEFNGALADAKGINKLIAAFFAAATPRTAGFNTVDLGLFSLPTVIITILLMWIGASPSSTGGGIKTSTFALAVMNVYSLVRGKQKIEIHKREVTSGSIQRAYAIMFLSLLVIGLAIFALAITEGARHSLSAIAFECFSAYSTVGLSLGITPQLTSAGKIVTIFTMFIGRVGVLTLLIGLIHKVRLGAYQYPSENVLIN